MKKKEIAKATVADIIAAYERAAAAHGPATAKGDIPAANEAYKLVNVYSKELRRRGLEAQKGLLRLLTSNDPEVRVCAAKDALEFAPEIAQHELERLIEAKFDCSIHAYLILTAWKNGKLRFS